MGRLFYFKRYEMIGKGRLTLQTPVKAITKDNVISVIQSVMAKFRENASDCQFLIDYKSGIQPLVRKSEKKVMAWIDNEVVDNVAKEVAEFWEGFAWSKPLTYVMRGEVDDTDSRKSEGIRKLNNSFSETGSEGDLQRLADFVETCGICYTLVDFNKEWEEGESYFTRDVLDPRNAFVIRSSYYSDRRIMLGVTFRYDEKGNIFMTAYSKDNVFDIVGDKIVDGSAKDFDAGNFSFRQTNYSGMPNPLRKVQVCEWIRSVDRTGVFESQISSMDNLNLLLSNISNGVQEGIECLWWANDLELETYTYTDEEGNEQTAIRRPQSGDWVFSQTPRDGKSPSIQPLVLDYHLGDMRENYLSQRTLILQKCHVPQRNGNSGSSSGLATETSSGWQEAESHAEAQETITVSCAKAELKVVLAALRESPDIQPDNPMLSLIAGDIDPCVRRPKNFDILAKVNAFCAFLAKGGSLEDALAIAPLVPDTAQLIARSGEGIRRYQEVNVWGNGQADEDTHLISNDAQVQNSPLIDGMTIGQTKDIVE